MNFAGRMNSVLFQNREKDIFYAIDSLKKIEGITHLEFNFPEHIAPYSILKVKEAVAPLKVNGVATRFRDDFIHGEFTNPNPKLNEKAMDLCKRAIDACRELNGEVVTIWLGFDGFDYPFQVNYEKKWNDIVRHFQDIADYANDLKISIEYKPFEPRSYSMIDGIGLTLLAIEEINRPNLGVTLDFCHLLMKKESPGYALTLAARKNKLFGLHLNDGYRDMDSGMIFGSVNIPQSIEFIYYLKKYAYDGVVFFDTFPIRENALSEIALNIESFRFFEERIKKVGLEEIENVINKQDGLSAQKLMLSLLK